MTDAFIYCNASKDGLATRSPMYLDSLEIVIKGFQRDMFFQNVQHSDLVVFLSECARKAVIEEKWDENEVRGVSWFIGNFVDIATKARIDLKDDYDSLFISVFIQYYRNDRSRMDLLNKSKSFYDFINFYQQKY